MAPKKDKEPMDKPLVLTMVEKGETPIFFVDYVETTCTGEQALMTLGFTKP